MTQQIYTFLVTARLDITAWLPLRARSVECAQKKLARINPRTAADVLTLSYDFNCIETGIECAVGDAVASEVPDVFFTRERAMLLDLPALPDSYEREEVGCVELTGNGLASKRYPIKAETQSKALATFLALDEEQLNAVPWNLWGVDFDDAYFEEQELEVDEQVLEAIAMLIEETL